MEKPRMYRVCGTPVRTGCVTCKKRHVKCDETRPSCKRCRKAQRICEGYESRGKEASQPPRVDGAATPLHVQPKQQPQVNVLIFALSPQERRSLSFFTKHTAQSLAGYSTSMFFTSLVDSPTLLIPCILHSCIALGALHQHFSSGQLSPSTLASPTSFVFALSQSSLALRHLHSLISCISTRSTPSADCSQQDQDNQNAALTACILFVVFDSFLGRYRSALIHLRSGIEILNSLRSSQDSQFLARQATFAPTLMRLSIQALVFLNPASMDDRMSLWLEVNQVTQFEKRTSFQNIEHAQYALNVIGAETLYELDSIRMNTSTPAVFTIGHLRAFAELKQWETMLKDFLARLDTKNNDTDRVLRAACLLKIYHIIITIVITIAHSNEPLFEEILVLADIVNSGRLTQQIPKTIDFSSDLGIVAPLFFVAMKCKNMKIRCRAQECLVKTIPRREGMWDAELCAMVVEKVLSESQVNEKSVEGTGSVNWESCALHKELQLRDKLALS